MSFTRGMALFMSLTLSIASYADTKCEFKTANDLLEAIKNNHPTLLKNEMSVEIAKHHVDEAGKLINPELEIEGISNLDESSKYSSSFKLTQTIELGGKRSARVNTAKSELVARATHAKLEAEDLVIETVKDIYRLRHLNELIPHYVEAIDAFQRIFKKLKKRNNLSADQEVEKETLELAINDYKLKLANLRVDFNYLNHHLVHFADKHCEIDVSALPKDLNLNLKLDELPKTELSFSKLRYAKQFADVQQARLNEEQAKAYSNLRIGPSFKVDKNDETVKRAGVSLSFDLPLFNRNGAGKAKARTALESASMLYKKFKREAKLDLYSWQTQYKKYVSSLKAMDGRDSLDRKHKKVDALFKRGIISTSLVIESHRQLIEYTSTRNEFELGAVEALWNIYNHSGVVMSKKI